MHAAEWTGSQPLSEARPVGVGARAWWAAFVALLGFLCVPFFLVGVPPVQDYPNHLARLYVLAFGAADPSLSAMYTPHWTVIPNLAIDLVGPPLMHLLPVSVVGRILLAASAILPVAGIVLYHRAVFRVRSWWPLASGVVAFNGIFFFGFMNYLYAVGLAFALAACWIAFRPRHPLVTVAGSAAGVVVLFFCHIAGPLLFALLVGTHEAVLLWQSRSREGLVRPAATRLLALFAALLPALVLFAVSPLAGAHGPLTWESPKEKLLYLFTPLATYDPRLTLLSAIVVVPVLALVFFRRPRVDVATAFAFVVIAAAYVVAPHKAIGGSVLEVRLTIVLAFLLVAGIRPALSAYTASAVAFILAALFVVRVTHVASVWDDHRSDLAELRSVIAAVPAGARVLAVTGAYDTPAAYLASEPAGQVPPDMYRVDEHLPAMLVIKRHAFWPQLFTDPSQQPLAVNPAYAAISDSLGELRPAAVLASDDPVATPPAPYLHDWPDRFDYVLVMDAGAMSGAPVRPDRLDLVKATHFAALYRVRPRAS